MPYNYHYYLYLTSSKKADKLAYYRTTADTKFFMWPVELYVLLTLFCGFLGKYPAAMLLIWSFLQNILHNYKSQAKALINISFYGQK